MINYLLIVLTLTIILGYYLTGKKERASEPGYIDCKGFKMITPCEAKELIDNNNVFTIDVRTKREYDFKHIPQAILIPLDTLEIDAPIKLPDKDANIIVYCQIGKRSKKAAELLVYMGYKNIFWLGGIVSWPYELYNDSKS